MSLIVFATTARYDPVTVETIGVASFHKYILRYLQSGSHTSAVRKL